jgi:ribosomal protein S18 acetylase RimI-like enzyme
MAEATVLWPVVAQIAVRVIVRDLNIGDIASLGWSGSPAHLASVREQLGRVPSGEVEYLAACLPSGVPVGKAEIDYARRAGAGTLCQAAVHPVLQSCGIGTLLVQVAEERITARGYTAAELAVEHDNPRARALYERLGYVAYGSEPDEWDAEGAHGRVVRHRTMCTLMRKPLRGHGQRQPPRS